MASHPSSVVTYHRPAREFPERTAGPPVALAPPPPVPSPGTGAALSLLLPLAGSLGMLGFAFIYHNVLFLALAGGIAVLTVVISVGMQVGQRRATKRQRRRQAARYREYLAEQGSLLARLADAQRRALVRVHPGPEGLWPMVSQHRHLWERRLADADFAEARVGLGETALDRPVELDLGSDPLVEREPELLAEVTALADDYRSLSHAPVCLPLRRLGALALIGEAEPARSLCRAMLCELAAAHAPEDLRLMAWFPPEDESAWDWMKWLPHARDAAVTGAEDLGQRAVSLSIDAADLDVLLTQVARPRLRHRDRSRRDDPYGEAPAFQQVVVVLDGYSPHGALSELAILDELCSVGADVGVTLVVLVRRPEDVPASCGARVELGPGGWVTVVEGGPDGHQRTGIRPDGASLALCESLARGMAPLRLRNRRARIATVDSEGLFDLLGASPEQDRGGPAGVALPRSAVGVGEDGNPLVLDLREAAQDGMGPHGLIVGATGSGKSELLRTLVSGLALSQGPEELAMVLVDFKGGATFAELGRLPQVAGMITNLERDLTLVDRMHEALFGELERRQRFLQEAGNFDRVFDYQVHRASHPEEDLAPCPSLLVIVDEFGELLTARPDFLDLFVSIGRTGRSLGVHLLLATQRLDEGRIRGLEGHLRYRVCLRTFSPEESIATLGTRDAFELPPLPGLGYLKVDQSMVRFKAATVSRPHRSYRPTVAEPSVVRAFRATGPSQALAVVGTPAALAEGMPPAPEGPALSELQVVVQRCEAASGDRPVRQVWRTPLPTGLCLDAVLGPAQPGTAAPAQPGTAAPAQPGTAAPAQPGTAAPAQPGTAAPAQPGTPGWLTVPIGLLDQPRQQAQTPLALDLRGRGGHLAVVGAPRSGKSTLLETVLASLALTHDPSDVNVYAVDLGGGGLHALAGLPHVGGVHGRSDADEIRRTVRELGALVDRRSAAFRRLRLESMDAYHLARASGTEPGEPYGETFLVIDNWAMFVQLFEDLQDEVASLVATGLHHGVHVVLSANRWADVRLALRDNIGGRLELHLNDPLESEIDRHAAKAVAVDAPGRGITGHREQFQAALPRIDGRADIGGLPHGLEGLVAAACDRWRQSTPAPVIPMLPDVVRAEDLTEMAAAPGVVLGLAEIGLAPFSVELFGTDPHFLALGDGGCGKTNLLREWARRLARAHGPDQVAVAAIDYRRQLTDAVERGRWWAYATTPATASDLVGRLVVELSNRLALVSDSDGADVGSWSGPQVVLVVDDYDLVAGATLNPLAPLVDLLAQGRDVGFHVVLARRVGGMARSAYEPLLQRLRELGVPTLLMSGDPQEGPVVGDVRPVPLPAGRGRLVHRRRVSLVQVGLGRTSGTAEEELNGSAHGVSRQAGGPVAVPVPG